MILMACTKTLFQCQRRNEPSCRVLRLASLCWDVLGDREIEIGDLLTMSFI